MSISLLERMIDNVVDEELRIKGHPQKDEIVAAIHDPNYFVTFSDVNKVGINPGTKFNTPAGIYGWHFTGETIEGAKKNDLFASGRKFGHLLKIKDGAKVLWLGNDSKTGGIPSTEEINSAIAKKYPSFTQDTLPILEAPSGPPGSNSPPKKMLASNKESDRVTFTSPEEWLSDPKRVKDHSQTSQRQSGGNTETEKLYDYVMAASLLLNVATGKKITILANGILRALGYDAVVDTDAKGIIHNAEKAQGFFTHIGGLDHVTTIDNRVYKFNTTAIYRILTNPKAPLEKIELALKVLLGSASPQDIDGDPNLETSFTAHDVGDMLDYATSENPNLTTEMLQAITAWARTKLTIGDNVLVAGKIIENIYAHPNAPQYWLEDAIAEYKHLDSIAQNPNAPPEFLGDVATGKMKVGRDIVKLAVSNPNIPPEALRGFADRYVKAGDSPRRDLTRGALRNPQMPSEEIDKVIRDEDGNLTDKVFHLTDVIGAPSLSDKTYDDIIDKLAREEFSESTADILLMKIINSPLAPDHIVTQALRNYRSFAGENSWRVAAEQLLMLAMERHKKPSKELLKVLIDGYKEIQSDRDKFVANDQEMEKIAALLKKRGAKLKESIDLRSLIKQTINEEISQERIRQVNEKLYKEYAERLSDEIRATFWDLPEEGKNFVIEDWISQGKPGQSLTEHLLNTRSELERPFRQLNEISSEVYDSVVDAAEDLSTEEMRPLFGNNERVIIPMASEENEQVKEFYEQIVEPLAAKGIKVDLKNGVATKEIETQRGKQERKTKLGKTIGRELSAQAQQWWNKFQADFLGNPDVLEAQDAIVITQHPVDVARMSDFSEADIESCHSQGSDYFRCALADAKRAGALAYLINGEDVPYAQEHINDNELFADSERDVDGIIPKARVRLRRFDNVDLASEGAPLALLAPETRVYGTKVPGFLSTVAAWARKVQKGHPVFDEKLDLRKFILRGGSYMDSTSKSMFNTLLGKDEYTQEDYGTRTADEENDIEYGDDAQENMTQAAEEAMNNARYDYLDNENVDFSFNVEWDDWNESPEVNYDIRIQFDYPVYKFIGAPNVGSVGGEHNYDEEEIIYGLSRQAAMGAVRDVAETTYEDSEHRNYDLDVNWSASIKDRPFGRGEKRKVVEIIAYIDDVTHDPDNFGDEVAREVQYITEAWEEIDAQIEAALKEDGWMIETPYDKLETDSEHPGKLGPESFDLFNISKGDRGIAARLIIPMKGYPAAGLRQDTTWSDAKVLYKEGPKFVEIMRVDGDDGWTVSGGYAVLPPKRRNNVLNALKKEIMDASKAAAMQPSLPMGDLPASKKKDMKTLLPAIENVQILFKQTVKGEMTPYRKKGSANYEAEGGIMFTFKPGISQEQIETNLRFVKYFDDNPEPVQAALQKEWDEIIDKFEANQPLVKPEAKKEKEPEEEASHLDAYKESVSSLLRNIIKESMEDEDYDGVDSIDYKGEHSAPMAEDGAPLWNITANGVYPDDAYGPNGMSWYGTGNRFLDSEAYSILRKAHGRRDKQLTVYRAVPKGVKGINRGDWVTTVRQYAKDHGESALNGEYSIIKKSVTARDIFTDGNSWLEWGYDPQLRISYSEREDWEKYPGKKKK